MTGDDVFEQLSLAEPIELLAHLQRANQALRENADAEIELSRNIRDAAVTAQLQDETTITGLLMLAQLPVFDDEAAFATALHAILCDSLAVDAAQLLLAEPDGSLRLVVPDDVQLDLETTAAQTSALVRDAWANGALAPLVEPTSEATIVALPLVRRGARLGMLALVAPTGAWDANTNWALLTLIGGIVAAVGERRARIAKLRSELRLIETLIGQRTLQIRQSRDILRAAFDRIDLGILLIDLDGRVVAANQTFCTQILGRHPRDVVGTSYAQLRDPQARGTPRATTDARVMLPAGSAQHSRVRHADAQGVAAWYQIERSAVPGDDGNTQYVLEIWRREVAP